MPLLKNIERELFGRKGASAGKAKANVDRVLPVLKSGKALSEIINELEELQKQEKKVILKDALAEASLHQDTQDSKGVLERFRLCRKIDNSNGEIDISTDELKILTKNLPKTHTIFIAGQAIEALEDIGKDEKPDKG